MTQFKQVAEALPEDQIQRMREALVTGKWPDGRVVSQAQRETTLEAVMLWEARHLPPQQRMGYMPPKPARKQTPVAPSGRIPTVSRDEH